MQHALLPTMRRLAALALCALLSLAFVGCASEEPAAQTQPQTLEIGENAGDVYALSLSNSSGKSVVSMAVKLPGDDSFSANLMSSDAHLKDGEDAIVYIPAGKRRRYVRCRPEGGFRGRRCERAAPPRSGGVQRGDASS